jgi:hypothetical protein
LEDGQKECLEHEEPVMRTCTICRFETQPDDMVVVHISGRCICLRCYTRETESAHPMSSALRRELMALLEGIAA